MTRTEAARLAATLGATAFAAVIAWSYPNDYLGGLAAVAMMTFAACATGQAFALAGRRVDAAMADLGIVDAAGTRHTVEDLAADLDPVPPVTTPDVDHGRLTDADLPDAALELGEAFELYLHALTRHPDLAADEDLERELADEVAATFRPDPPPEAAGASS